MPRADDGAHVQRHRRPHVLVAQRRAARAGLEGEPHLDLPDHRTDGGLAEGALVLGRHVGADGEGGRGIVLKTGERKKRG